MFAHSSLTASKLHSLVRTYQICFAGNQSLKIYGKLSCSSGKRMKKENRIFFKSESEAKKYGYRPCGHCLKDKYKIWKNKSGF